MYFKEWQYNYYISELLNKSVIFVMQENNHLIYILVTLSYLLCYKTLSYGRLSKTNSLLLIYSDLRNRIYYGVLG